MGISNHDWLAFTLANIGQSPKLSFEFPNGRATSDELGVLTLEPNGLAQHSVVLSVGIHGNETAPIELVNELVGDILRGNIPLSVRLLVIIGHPQAIVAAQRFCDVNLNRLFCGAWQRYEGMEVARAQQLELSLKAFFDGHQDGMKLHYDLHTAIRGSQYEKFAVHPFTGSRAFQKSQFAFYAAMGLEAVLLSHQPTTTFSYHSYAQHGAEAATVELGKVMPIGQNDLSALSKLREALTHLLSKAELRQGNPEGVKLFTVVDSLVKDADDYALSISKEEKNFTAFEQGYELAKSNLSQYLVKQAGDAIVFPNTNLPIGQRAGLVVRPLMWNEFNAE